MMTSLSGIKWIIFQYEGDGRMATMKKGWKIQFLSTANLVDLCRRPIFRGVVRYLINCYIRITHKRKLTVVMKISVGIYICVCIANLANHQSDLS